MGLYVNNPTDSTMSLAYQQKYAYLNSTQQYYSNWGQTLDISSSLSIATELLSTFASAIIMGLTSLEHLIFTMSGLQSIIRTLMMDSDLAQFSIIFGLLLTVFMIWLTYRALSEARGTAQS